MQTAGHQLKDRYLWFDGHCTLEPDSLADLILKGHALSEKFHVTKLNREVKEFNRVADFELTKKTELEGIPNDWLLPEKYKKLDVRLFVYKKLLEETDRVHFEKAATDARIKRVDEELALFDEFGLYPLIRLLIYIVDRFVETKTVWGVGRGSSCASYILYLIGIHDVDSVEFELDINEFLR